MNPILRNILAVVAGGIVGMVVNMGLVMLGPSIVPMPEGWDPNDYESIKNNMHLLTTGNLVMTWLAHGVGTLAGAYTTARLAASNHKILALLIGAFFLIGGIMAVNMFGGPTGFIIADLALAYIPMAYLGWWLASR